MTGINGHEMCIRDRDWIHQKEVEFVSGKNKLKGYIFWNAKDLSLIHI